MRVQTSTGFQRESWRSKSACVPLPLIDTTCARKVKNDPDAHTRACALQCAGSGYGIQTSDGRYPNFDKAGNEQVFKPLKATTKNDHLRVNVNGDQRGDTIAVKSITELGVLKDMTIDLRVGDNAVTRPPPADRKESIER